MCQNTPYHKTNILLSTSCILSEFIEHIESYLTIESSLELSSSSLQASALEKLSISSLIKLRMNII